MKALQAESCTRKSCAMGVLLSHADVHAHARLAKTVLAGCRKKFTSSFFTFSFASASLAASTSSLLGTAGAIGSSPCSQDPNVRLVMQAFAHGNSSMIQFWFKHKGVNVPLLCCTSE